MRSRIWLAVPVLLVLALRFVFTQDPLEQDLSAALSAPSPGHLLGTDQFGRDLAARLAVGARTTLMLAVTVVAAAAGVGILVGLATAALSGSLRGAADRLVDIGLGMPSLLVALALVGTWGASPMTLVLAMTIGLWPWYARLARDHAVVIERASFVDHARLLGVPSWRIWTQHVLPHVVRRLGIVAALDVGYTVVALAGLSYLGLGAAPPNPELGVILREGQDFVFDAPWLLAAPAALVVLIVMPFVLASEALHERGVLA